MTIVSIPMRSFWRKVRTPEVSNNLVECPACFALITYENANAHSYHAHDGQMPVDDAEVV